MEETPGKLPGNSVATMLRIALLVPFVLAAVGIGFALTALVAEGPSATVYFPSRTGSGQMNAVAALVCYGLLAAVSIFSGWFVPRSVARRREALERFGNTPKEH